MKKKRGPGRPPLPADKRRSNARRVPLYPTAVELRALEAWARRRGVPLARLILATAVEAAR